MNGDESVVFTELDANTYNSEWRMISDFTEVACERNQDNGN